LICVAVAVAICWPLAGTCGENTMAVGFQFSATSPLTPDKLTDFAESGLHFRTFYRVTSLSDKWHVLGEFGYNNFGLDDKAYGATVGPVLIDAINELFPLGPSLPDGSIATLSEVEISGGAFNSMHLTGGVQYMFFGGQDRALNPYVTAQGGLYSFGQSDTDVGLTVDVDRPASLADTTLSFPLSPFLRDDDRDNAFGLSLGGGAEFSVTDAVALVGDFRYHVAFTEEKKTSFVDVGLGLVYFLGF
jgi:hypothetical protein